MNRAGVIEDALGGGRLAGVDMSRDADVPYFRQIVHISARKRVSRRGSAPRSRRSIRRNSCTGEIGGQRRSARDRDFARPVATETKQRAGGSFRRPAVV